MNIYELGEAHGEIKGQKKALILQICKKLTKGKLPAEIADALEEDLSVVEQICSIANDFAPEYDCDKIYQQFIQLQ